MQRMRNLLLASLLVLFPVAPGSAAQSSLTTLRVPVEDLIIRPSDTYCIIELPGAVYPARPGYPELPAINRMELLSSGTIPVSIEIVEESWISIPGITIPRPQPEPEIISVEAVKAKVIHEECYSGGTPFPRTPVELKGTCRGTAGTYAEIQVNPVRFIPDQSRIQVLENLSYRVIVRSDPIRSDHSFSATDSAHAAYLIITSDSLAAAFQPLADWRTETGLNARILTVEWIEVNAPGTDLAEKIRNTIINEYRGGSLQYVLLGGNRNIIPIRTVWAMDCEADYYPGENDIGADLYYADLDGTWDEDGDGIFGEVTDGVDLYPEIHVGRAPVDLPEEAESFVQKVMTYERNPPADYVSDALFFAEVLWNNPYTDSGIHKDRIDLDLVPGHFDPITKLYESDGTETVDSVMAALNTGGHLANHDGHAFTTVIGAGNGYIGNDDVDTLTNGDRLWILYSIGCWSAAFDSECIAERFMTNPNGGTVAYIGNFRYGWGSPGHPGFGYSDVFDYRFYQMIFELETTEIGRILSETKQYFIPQSNEENVYRWHQYQLNLLGDPAMPVWTDVPVIALIDHPASINAAAGKIPVWVAGTGGALPGSRVCVSRNGELIATASTNSAGYAEIILPSELPGAVILTVTGRNLLPYRVEIPLLDRPELRVTDLMVVDDGSFESDGNGNNAAEAGETVAVFIEYYNAGGKEAPAGTMEIQSTHPDLQILSGIVPFDAVPANGTGSQTEPFLLSVSPGAGGNELIPVTISFSMAGIRQNQFFNFRVGRPDLHVDGFLIQDFYPAGDLDGWAEPGETFYLNLLLANHGWAKAMNLRGELNAPGGDLTILTPLVRYPEIDESEKFGGYNRFKINLPDDMAVPGVIPLDLNIQMDGHPDRTIPIHLPVGETWTTVNFDTGEDGWTHEGTNDTWHRTTDRSDTGAYSWYCGSEGEHEYQPNIDASIVSPEIFFPDEPILQFSRWFDFPMYGTDGVFVDYSTGADWESLLFIGSGGALLNLQSEWQTVSLKLPVDAGYGRIRFRFVSDASNQAEGVYIDSVRIQGISTEPWGTEPELPAAESPACDDLGVLIWMPSTYYYSGDNCGLKMIVCNPSISDIVLDLYVLLDLYGSYFFATDWTSDPQSISVVWPSGQTVQEIIPEFAWPSGSGTASGLAFWAGLVDPLAFSLAGEYGFWEFGWDAQ